MAITITATSNKFHLLFLSIIKGIKNTNTKTAIFAANSFKSVELTEITKPGKITIIEIMTKRLVEYKKLSISLFSKLIKL